MRQRTLLLSLLATVALGFGYLLLHSAPGVQTLRNAVARTGDGNLNPSSKAPAETTKHNLPVAKPVTRKGTKAAALPSPGTPLARIYDDLAARARAGDTAAAMRLLHDLQQCNARVTATSVANRSLAQRNKETDSDGASVMDAWAKKLLDNLDALDKLCAGITPDQVDRRGEWLRNAALAGDAEAMVCYAVSPNDFGPKYLSDAWFDWAQRWREEAPQFASQAFAAGQADVIGLLLDAYSNSPMVDVRYTQYQFGQLISPDPILEYAYAVLYERVVPLSMLHIARNRVDITRASLLPGQVSQGQAFAEAAWPRFAAQAREHGNFQPCEDGLFDNSPYR